MTLTADPVLNIGATFHPVSINQRESNRFLTTMDFKTNVFLKNLLFRTLLANTLFVMNGQSAAVRTRNGVRKEQPSGMYNLCTNWRIF